MPIDARILPAFADELCKLAGLPRPPAVANAAVRKLSTSLTKPAVTGTHTVTGGAGLAKAMSPTTIVPPPPISA